MTVWVLMTAMPPTVGHRALIEFAATYAGETDSTLRVLLSTQPDEPFVQQRFWALDEHIRHSPRSNLTYLYHFNKKIEQNPEAPGFWDMWRDIFHERGAKDGDTYIASEGYGKRLAEELNGKFMPFDIGREIFDTKATAVRKNLLERWNEILPEFAKFLTQTVTIFGAESTGKTTLTKALAEKMSRDFPVYAYFEYARPYLENTENVITVASMTDIWKGQVALQKMDVPPRPFVLQDTDLFSTVGYWDFPHWEQTLGGTPFALRQDADWFQSDLYIITKSDIPFEEDPLRYGGTVREGSDEYWIDICEKNGLNYIVLDVEPKHRLEVAYGYCLDLFKDHAGTLHDYEREVY